MKISYLVTCHNEESSLKNLLELLATNVDAEDEIIVLDDYSDNPETLNILKTASSQYPNITLFKHALNNDYGSHKNHGITLCNGEWVFQLDGDELPSLSLIVNLKEIISSNPDTELFFVPRINDFIGVTEEHARQWGWKLTRFPEYDNRPIVNWPDFQSRVFKRIPDRIKWNRKLHEQIVGHSRYSILPPDIALAIYHDKTIETQIKTNLRYNEQFSKEENQGHGVFK